MIIPLLCQLNDNEASWLSWLPTQISRSMHFRQALGQWECNSSTQIKKVNFVHQTIDHMIKLGQTGHNWDLSCPLILWFLVPWNQVCSHIFLWGFWPPPPPSTWQPESGNFWTSTPHSLAEVTFLLNIQLFSLLCFNMQLTWIFFFFKLFRGTWLGLEIYPFNESVVPKWYTIIKNCYKYCPMLLYRMMHRATGSKANDANVRKLLCNSAIWFRAQHLYTKPQGVSTVIPMSKLTNLYTTSS